MSDFCRFLEIFDQGVGISGSMGRSVPFRCRQAIAEKCIVKSAVPKLYDLSLPWEAKGDILPQGSHDILAERDRNISGVWDNIFNLI
ncbi:hypothetical protein CEXT_78271 [Caerostris extrusa]|uniref:Uncharacterized protein n=1 Tax=Caerostris extrusa TaxID=172846 RepID=A0AAV4QEZ4_CAEEX|nr:hypothetical protein CEXT_78271 [Caerostris extrusa]